MLLVKVVAATILLLEIYIHIDNSTYESKKCWWQSGQRAWVKYRPDMTLQLPRHFAHLTAKPKV